MLSDSAFFKHYFPLDNKKMIILPYVAQDRFQSKKSFQDRKNKAIAMGSVGIEFDMYNDIYGTNQLHPMRRMLYDHREENTDVIDCMIEEIKKIVPKFKISGNEKRIIKYFKVIANHFDSIHKSPFHQNGENAGYYMRDLVELFNEYRMFIYPEEVTGVPAQGFVEGINCGCAYIGLDSPMYTKLGMKPGVHYIGYNGSYDDLIEKIHYYQEHSDELERIAENGYRFAKENLNAEAVFKRFIDQF